MVVDFYFVWQQYLIAGEEGAPPLGRSTAARSPMGGRASWRGARLVSVRGGEGRREREEMCEGEEERGSEMRSGLGFAPALTPRGAAELDQAAFSRPRAGFRLNLVFPLF